MPELYGLTVSLHGPQKKCCRGILGINYETIKFQTWIPVAVGHTEQLNRLAHNMRLSQGTGLQVPPQCSPNNVITTWR